MWYWFFKFIGLGPAAWFWLRLRWSGRDNIPRSGPVILAANHGSFLDPIGVSMGVPRKVVYVAKTKYYSGRSLGGRFLAWFLKAIGQLPIDPESATTANPAIETARRLLDDGGVVAIFPEGTRSPDGRLYRGRTGVARLALPSRVPVIPVGIVGSREALQRLPRRSRGIHIIYGAPVDLSPWYDRADDPDAWREATDLLLTHIAALTGQEYVDRYPTADEIGKRDRA